MSTAKKYQVIGTRPIRHGRKRQQKRIPMIIKQTLWVVLAALCLVCSSSRSKAAQTGDFDLKQAKKACETFVHAVIARDLDGLVKITEVPWYEHFDKSRVILKRDDLDKELKKLTTKAQAPPKVVLEFKDTLTYELVLEKFGANLPAEERKLLDQVLKKTDYVLEVVINSPEGENLAEVVMLVGLRDGKAKVVGLRAR
jgi:hypothetical protein